MKISEFTRYSYLPRPDHFLDFWAFANVGLIIFFLYLLGSRFIFSPGITVDLPQITGPLTAVPTTGILSLSNDHLFFFDGHILSRENLNDALREFLAHHPQRPAILLIRPDKSLSSELLCQVCAIAKRSGFEQIQIACLEKDEKAKESS
jgi:biopolymer transport protein ExbD